MFRTRWRTCQSALRREGPQPLRLESLGEESQEKIQIMSICFWGFFLTFIQIGFEIITEVKPVEIQKYQKYNVKTSF